MPQQRRYFFPIAHSLYHRPGSAEKLRLFRSELLAVLASSPFFSCQKRSRSHSQTAFTGLQTKPDSSLVLRLLQFIAIPTSLVGFHPPAAGAFFWRPCTGHASRRNLKILLSPVLPDTCRHFHSIPSQSVIRATPPALLFFKRARRGLSS